MALARSTEQPETRGCRPTLLRIEATRRLLAHSPSLSPEAVIGQAPLVQQTASGAACHGGAGGVPQHRSPRGGGPARAPRSPPPPRPHTSGPQGAPPPPPAPPRPP